MNTNTMFKSDTLDKCYEYINQGYEEQGDLIPSVAGLACYLGGHEELIHGWSKKYPPIAKMKRELMAKQQRLLIHGGLTGKFNATIAKLILSKHGYNDKVEQTISHSLDITDNKPAVFQGVSKDITPRPVEVSERPALEHIEDIEPDDSIEQLDADLTAFKQAKNERPAPICIPATGALARRRARRSV